MSYGAVKKKEKKRKKKAVFLREERKQTVTGNLTNKTSENLNNQNSLLIYDLHFKNIFIHIFFLFFFFRHILYGCLCNMVTLSTTKVTN